MFGTPGVPTLCWAGTRETMGNRVTKTIAVIPGDGIGSEVVDQALRVLDALCGRFGLDVATTMFSLGSDEYLRTGVALPESVADELAGYDAILLGALGDPRVAPGILERGVIVALRTRFRQAVNVRPCKLFPGVAGPLAGRGPADCDFVILRENTEGLYTGGGSTTHVGSDRAVAVHTSITTVPATRAIVEYAFDLAQRRRGHLTLCHKTNILVDAGRIWSQVVEEAAARFPSVTVDYAHVDAMCLHLVQHPERYDVIVTDNLFGDILSDLGAAITGGLGTAASANLNLDGSGPSMFEPVHGSAPDIAGTGTANPAATILSLALLLGELGMTQASQVCTQAVEAVLSNFSPDLPAPSTAEFGDMVIERIRA